MQLTAQARDFIIMMRENFLYFNEGVFHDALCQKWRKRSIDRKGGGMGNYVERFRVKPGSKVKLKDIDPDFKDMEKEVGKKQTENNLKRLGELQELLYAEHKRSLLVCLQAIDAGGKDGTIRNVFGSLNPQGVKVMSFKQPTSQELDHDFMWRAHRDAPGKGEITVFNRSHYEDVLVVRIHDLVPKAVWSARYEQINALEKYLTDNGTHILKFFLCISKEEQLKRFKDRLDEPAKHWKISASDYSERERWGDYMEAFEDMLSKCSTAYAPWFVIPANNKWFRNLAISEILVEYLEGLKMQFPEPSVKIEDIRKQYEAAKKAS